MKNLLNLLLVIISIVQAGTVADGATCLLSSDCLNYVSASPTTGSVCNPCVFGSNLVYLCVNYLAPDVPTGTTYAVNKISCRV